MTTQNTTPTLITAEDAQIDALAHDVLFFEEFARFYDRMVVRTTAGQPTEKRLFAGLKFCFAASGMQSKANQARAALSAARAARGF